MSQPFLQFWLFHASIYRRQRPLCSWTVRAAEMFLLSFPDRCLHSYVVFLRKVFDLVVGFLRPFRTRSEPRSPLPWRSGVEVLAGVLSTSTGQNFTSLGIRELFGKLVGNAEMQNYCTFGKQSNFSDLAKSGTTFTLTSSGVWANVDSFPHDYVDPTWPPI